MKPAYKTWKYNGGEIGVRVENPEAFEEIFKKPKTDDGMKNSAKGFLAVLRSESADGVENLFLVDQVSKDTPSCLKEVFCDGKLLIDQHLVDIRKRISDNL
jgi:nicotinamide phosphoribosyltransferase